MATVKTQLLNALQEKFPENQFKYNQIIKTLKIDVKGQDYQPTRDRGFYACNISRGGYLTYGSKSEPRYLKKLHNGNWSVDGPNVQNQQPHYTKVYFVLNGLIHSGDLIGTDRHGNSRVRTASGIIPILIKQKTLRTNMYDAKNDLRTFNQNRKKTELEKIELRKTAWEKYTLELKRIDNL